MRCLLGCNRRSSVEDMDQAEKMAQARKEELCSFLIAFSSILYYTLISPSSVLNLILAMLLDHLYTHLVVGVTLGQAALLPRQGSDACVGTRDGQSNVKYLINDH